MQKTSFSPRSLALLASLVAPLACYSPPPPPEGSAGSAGTMGGTGGSSGGAGGATGGSAGTTGGSAGTTGGTGGTAGSSGGTTGGSAGATGGSAGTTAGAGGSTGGTAGSSGAMTGGAAGATGGAAGATGGAAGTTGGSAGAGGVAGSAAGSAGNGGSGGKGGNLRITLLGDSTTSDGCFRAHLSQMLTADNHAFTFVGTRNGDPGCVGTYNHVNEGHGGYIVSDILKATSTGRPGGADASDPYVSGAGDLALWFDGHPTDVVLMNFGTNDVSNNIAATTIVNAFTAILTRLRANNANVRMLVAQIPPINWTYCLAATCDPRVNALNAAIVTWAAAQTTTASPVTVVDQHTGYNTATDTVDGVHANESGSVKLANIWYAALTPLF